VLSFLGVKVQQQQKAEGGSSVKRVLSSTLLRSLSGILTFYSPSSQRSNVDGEGGLSPRKFLRAAGPISGLGNKVISWLYMHEQSVASSSNNAHDIAAATASMSIEELKAAGAILTPSLSASSATSTLSSSSSSTTTSTGITASATATTTTATTSAAPSSSFSSSTTTSLFSSLDSIVRRRKGASVSQIATTHDDALGSSSNIFNNNNNSKLSLQQPQQQQLSHRKVFVVGYMDFDPTLAAAEANRKAHQQHLAAHVWGSKKGTGRQ